MRNIGNLDANLRILIGLALLCLTFIGPKTIWGFFGLVPLITGLIAFCPLYQFLGISSYNTSNKG